MLCAATVLGHGAVALLLPYTVGVQLVSQHHLTFIQLIIFYIIYWGIFQDMLCTADRQWSSSPYGEVQVLFIIQE